jgi:hypothetical protein
MYCVVSPVAVTASVPEVVTGELATENALGIVSPTLVTVPLVIVGNVAKVPSPLKYCEVVPVGSSNLAFKAFWRSVWLDRVPVIEPQVPPPPDGASKLTLTYTGLTVVLIYTSVVSNVTSITIMM